MNTVVIEIEHGAERGSRQVHLDRTVQIGRAPENELVLQDSEVSWRHAMLYTEGGHIWIRDLGSRNGTLVDGEKITSPARLSDRSRVKIGPVDLRVRRAAPRAVPLMLEEVGTGVQHPLIAERFVIGDSDAVNLRVSGMADPVTILVPGNNEVWYGQDGEDHPVELGQITTVSGFEFVVREGDPNRVPTVEASGALYRYALEASLDGGPGPIAVLRDATSSTEVRFTAETRAVLLYSLGRQILDDRESGRDPMEEGWVADPDLIVAVWGRTPLSDGLARLKTLVHRVRADCRDGGLDPWCVEKRRGYTRIRAETVVI